MALLCFSHTGPSVSTQCTPKAPSASPRAAAATRTPLRPARGYALPPCVPTATLSGQHYQNRVTQDPRARVVHVGWCLPSGPVSLCVVCSTLLYSLCTAVLFAALFCDSECLLAGLLEQYPLGAHTLLVFVLCTACLSFFEANSNPGHPLMISGALSFLHSEQTALLMLWRCQSRISDVWTVLESVCCDLGCRLS
jgi:hypothetical protein